MAKMLVVAVVALISVAVSACGYEENEAETVYVTDYKPLGTHRHARCAQPTAAYDYENDNDTDHLRRNRAPERDSYRRKYEPEAEGDADEAAAAPPCQARTNHRQKHRFLPTPAPGPNAAADISRSFTDALMDPGCRVAGPGFSSLMLSLIEANHGNMPVVSV
ncbi:hypothetical protein H4R19_005551 [Coemansia spiralis]|nr:hypothetical protein H4R19_005551 [Coemansia spiralis]